MVLRSLTHLNDLCAADIDEAMLLRGSGLIALVPYGAKGHLVRWLHRQQEPHIMLLRLVPLAPHIAPQPCRS